MPGLRRRLQGSLHGTARTMLALGRQAQAVDDDPVRGADFGCLLDALEQATYWETIASGPMFGSAMAGDTFRTIYAAAMGMYDERALELTGYTPETRLPSAFDVDWAVAGEPDPFEPSEGDAYRAASPADGCGPDCGPAGGGCPPESDAAHACDLTATWNSEEGVDFGGTANCPAGRTFSPNVRIVL